ncbi:MAG: PqiC family protein [Victivallales bacterium]|jgi:hypothetical protein|nr:PqiC family protein [Victivallales bacterium]
MNRIVAWGVTISVILLSGCVFKSYYPVAEFDLPAVKVDSPAFAMHIMEFRNNSISGSRFQARDASGQVFSDPYNKWVLPPEQLIARTLNLTLQHPERKSETRIPITGELDIFNVESATKTFRFAGSWSPTYTKREYQFDFSVPLKGDSPLALVEAAREAVGKLAQQLSSWSHTERKEKK